MSLSTVRTVRELRERVGAWRRAGETVGVVPTMGALHAGHLSLVEAAQARTRRVIVTLFVNPRQFNNASDLAAYPRTEKDDAAKLDPLGVDVLFAPDVAEMYAEGFATTVSVGGVSEGLCGANRPGHFDGVATVVSKLLLQSGADFAFFGEKDYQQLQVVRRLVADLNIPVEIVGCPTVREEDGLALSSRNVRLSSGQRAVAPALARELFLAASALSQGKDVAETLAKSRVAIADAGFDPVEYLELRDAETLQPVEHMAASARLLAAAWLGETRLIDNVAVTPA
ncbi:pantoate--beta-alanine ligase [Nitratireductor indicus]|uniref:Pantothenate synthetase n=1 Tax=Nitratireductor indicus C115 TaxID=1231190 RepID=K2N1Q4_9HYPH|nr:pantoate--beta-alanine ligase [Nitratireductor indicus]EKF41413.1 pantoate--beta-alanine ligase [Nitratireductor indicus C115]MDS1138432.1 pantoate--beta-alanine ligase [Nitratireductor indicus]SFQ72066.1 pantoate--beta-alanine ligase [Nitratireductor indicus]